MTPEQHELLSAYVDGDVTDVERKEAEALLASDEEARRELAALRTLTGLLRSLPRVQAPESVTNAVSEQLRRRAENVAPIIPMRTPRWFAWAAAACILAAAGVVFVLPNLGQPQTPTNTATNEQSSTLLGDVAKAPPELFSPSIVPPPTVEELFGAGVYGEKVLKLPENAPPQPVGARTNAMRVLSNWAAPCTPEFEVSVQDGVTTEGLAVRLRDAMMELSPTAEIALVAGTHKDAETFKSVKEGSASLEDTKCAKGDGAASERKEDVCPNAPSADSPNFPENRAERRAADTKDSNDQGGMPPPESGSERACGKPSASQAPPSGPGVSPRDADGDAQTCASGKATAVGGAAVSAQKPKPKKELDCFAGILIEIDESEAQRLLDTLRKQGVELDRIDVAPAAPAESPVTRESESRVLSGEEALADEALKNAGVRLGGARLPDKDGTGKTDPAAPGLEGGSKEKDEDAAKKMDRSDLERHREARNPDVSRGGGGGAPGSRSASGVRPASPPSERPSAAPSGRDGPRVAPAAAPCRPVAGADERDNGKTKDADAGGHKPTDADKSEQEPARLARAAEPLPAPEPASPDAASSAVEKLQDKAKQDEASDTCDPKSFARKDELRSKGREENVRNAEASKSESPEDSLSDETDSKKVLTARKPDAAPCDPAAPAKVGGDGSSALAENAKAPEAPKRVRFYLRLKHAQ